MKKIVLFLLVLIVGACNSKNEIPKPAKPIEKAVMEDILYDLALLQALKSYSPEKLTKNNINSKTYIYQKYKIDSLQLVENNKYYASDFAEYQIMFNHVAERLEKQKAEMDTLAKKEEKKTQKKKKDSLANISKLAEPKN
jgi:hypothetical protein